MKRSLHTTSASASLDQGGLTFDKNFVITVNNLVENAVPTDIALSKTTVDENQPVNTVVGALSAVDPDAGATFTFSLACTVDGVDDASFNINGTDLRTSAVFDYETKSVYNVCIRVTDQGGLTFDQNFVVTVNDLNETPTDLFLSSATVDENQPVNTVVGVLSATDPDEQRVEPEKPARREHGGDVQDFVRHRPADRAERELHGVHRYRHH